MTDSLGNNYPNPLDNFRSYSYHFILTVGSSTEALRELVTPGQDGKTKLLGAVENVGLGERLKTKDTAYLLLDTRRFSQFSITELEMEHMYGTGDRVNPSVPTSLTRVKLIDTTGLTFFNYLADTLRNKLKTTRASAFFLLSVVFVGHKDDGTTETVSTCNIPLILLLMGFKFTSSGSVYDIEFIETEGAAQRGQSMEQINYMGGVNSTTTMGGPPTLGQMLMKLEQNLNIQSLAHFQKYSNTALLAGGGGDRNAPKAGKLVQYMITIPEEWSKFKTLNASPSEHREQFPLAERDASVEEEETKKPITPEERAEAEGVYYSMSFSSTTTITDAIKRILESAPDFLKNSGREAVNSGKGFSFKTVTNITSNKNTYLIHFDVYPVKIPKPKPDESQTSDITPGRQQRNVAGQASEFANLITYDYIFTGLNSHIKDLTIEYLPESAIALDSEMDIGGNRFDTNASVGQVRETLEEAKTGVLKTQDFAPMLRPNDPIFLPIQTIDQKQNLTSMNIADLDRQEAVTAFKQKQEYTQTLAFFHFLSSINLDMTIRGNPNLMRKYADRDTRGGLAPHGEIIDTPTLEGFFGEDQDTAQDNYLNSIQGGLGGARAQYYSEYYNPRLGAANAPPSGTGDALINNVDISTSQIFVKVNILAPNVDYNGERIDNEPLYTDSFFFKGPYMVLFIKHSLIDGEFTQSLNMIPFDVGGTYSQSRDNEQNDNQIAR